MRLSTKTTIATTLILCAFQGIALAAECSAKSGAQTVPLLELYTSEGCSSCPPADTWMSTIKSSQKANQVTPLAFHVDYWDYIGWKDRFAKPQYSERQRKASTFGSASYVYTPQFLLNGHDFRGGNDSRFNNAIEAAQKQPARANLQLEASTQADGSITLKANAQAASAHAEVFVALYENGLVSQVKAGENSGSTLKHDYVVRELFGAYPISNQFSKNFTLTPEWKNRDAGVVIFVQDSTSGEILQSLNLKFCG